MADVAEAAGAAVQQFVRRRPIGSRLAAGCSARRPLGHAGEVGELALRKLYDDRLGLLLPAAGEGLRVRVRARARIRARVRVRVRVGEG